MQQQGAQTSLGVVVGWIPLIRTVWEYRHTLFCADIMRRGGSGDTRLCGPVLFCCLADIAAGAMVCWLVIESCHRMLTEHCLTKAPTKQAALIESSCNDY